MAALTVFLLGLLILQSLRTIVGMGALDFRSSRRRSPWRIMNSVRSVFGFSRSRSRAESRHGADYAMSIRGDGIDKRFNAPTTAVAWRLHESTSETVVVSQRRRAS